MISNLVDQVQAVERAIAPDIDKMIDNFLIKTTTRDRLNYYPSLFTSRYWCKRQHVIHKLFFESNGFHYSETNKVSGRIFGMGNLVHKYLQDDVFSGDVRFLGKWQCVACKDKDVETIIGTNDNFVSKPDSGCPKCGYNLWEYAEVRAVNTELNWSGRIDGIIEHARKRYLLDIKTKDSAAFANMIEPEYGYVQQLQCYMEATGIHQAILFYVEKNRLKSKTYIIHYDPTSLAKLYESTIHEVNDKLAKGKIPRRHSWCTKGSWMEQGCIYGAWGLDTCRGPRNLKTMTVKVQATPLHEDMNTRIIEGDRDV